MKRLFLIDGHSLIFKMYYAFLRRPMINSKGVDTSIPFGFTKYILELAAKEQATHMAIAFDPPGKTFRHEMFPEYKGTRSETPQAVIDALEPLIDICGALQIPVLMKSGFEADDVIGSFAKQQQRNGFTVYMVTVDKDYGQLLSDNIIQFKPGKSGSESELFTAEDLCGKFGISRPEQFIDILAIWGDTADNVPGVKGIGEVGAGKLISEYGSIDNIYANIDNLKPRQKEAFEQARQSLALSRKLVTIKTDIPIEVSEEELRISFSYDSRVAEMFRELEFTSLSKLLPASKEDTLHAEKPVLKCEMVTEDEFVKAAYTQGAASFAISDTGIAAASGRDGEKVCIFKFPISGTLQKLLSEGNVDKIGYDLKTLAKASAGRLEGKLYDIELMHYVLDPEKSHRIEMLSQAMLGINASECELPFCGDSQRESATAQEADLFSMAESQPEESLPVRQIVNAILSLRLREPLEAKLREDESISLYMDVEAPMILVLADMELTGVKIDPVQLQQYRVRLESKAMELEGQIRTMASEPALNVSSPRQLGVILYEKLGLNPKVKKSAKGAYPTDEETLNDLPVKHPIVEKILEFRGLKKLISTYIDPLPSLVNASTGKIHPTFNQALTATGRLSCSKPNLQNIPIRTEQGREIRKAFVPSTPDGYIMSADYSQIELRIMAHFSCDPHMIEAFNAGSDIHTMTAAKIFKVPEEQVTKEQRRIAKTANFGIIYGISAFGLSQRLGISRSEAKKLIEDYFENFRGIDIYIKDCIAATLETGYAKTILGRRRYLPDIRSRNNTVRSLAERNAVNAPIQGSAADIIKMAMVNIHARIEEQKLQSRMILQVHDELVFDVRRGEEETLAKIVRREMEQVMKLSVPLTVDCNWADNWLDAH